MKRITNLLALTTIGLSVLTGCKKSTDTVKAAEEPAPTIIITAEDAADLVATAVSSGGYGFATSTSEAAQKTNTVSGSASACLYSLDTTFNKVNPSSSAITYSFNSNVNYQMYCNNGALQNMVVKLASTGNINLAPMSASSASNGTLTLNGLNSTATSYTASGTYVRSGSAASKVREKNSFTYALTLTVNNLVVAKNTYVLQGGDGSVTVSATTSNGTVYNFSGTLTYVSATSATLVMNGKAYAINLPACLAN